METVALYLDTCQVDTPEKLVRATWDHVHQLRGELGHVVDFGAGDGRFALGGRYKRYEGFEIDEARLRGARLPANARLLNQCAFSANVADADLCIGNPPFVRNQHLPDGWRRLASKVIKERTKVALSGLANAWQYFFFLALTSVKENGLCALVVPYEWVSRPAAAALRDYIRAQGYGVDVYRLVDSTFDSVLTTASITIVDKARRDGVWRYFEETAEGKYTAVPSATGAAEGLLRYRRRSDVAAGGPRAIRGLSPGTQKLLTLTEGQRIHFGLKIGRDVAPCVTTLRHVPAETQILDEATFSRHYQSAGERCWLIRTDIDPSPVLLSYLESTDVAARDTSTCNEREVWWRFTMPPVPDVLMSMSFRTEFPKAVENVFKARAVGGVCGVYNLDAAQVATLTSNSNQLDLRKRVVAHSNGLRKIEINQLNALMQDIFSPVADA